MKILLIEWIRDWRGAEPQRLKPVVFALDDDKMLFALVVSLGNSIYDEVCIGTASAEAHESIKDILCGTGNAKPVECSPTAEQCRVYRPRYEIYLQAQTRISLSTLSPGRICSKRATSAIT